MTILLNSMGGSPESALFLHNLIRSFPIPIHTHNISTVQSAANVLFLGGHKRFCDPHATFMFHKTVFNVQQAALTPEQLALQSSGIANSDRITVDLLTDISGQPKSVFADILDGDKLHTATDAKRLEFIDAICPVYMPPDSRFIQVNLS